MRRSIESVFEVDSAEFKRKALRELSGVLDFHTRGADEPVLAGRVCSVWKQLVEDNLATAAGMKYPRKWPRALRNLSSPELLAGCPPIDDFSSLLITCAKSQEKSTS